MAGRLQDCINRNTLDLLLSSLGITLKQQSALTQRQVEYSPIPSVVRAKFKFDIKGVSKQKYMVRKLEILISAFFHLVLESKF